MKSYQSAVSIARPPEHVFRFLTEPEKQAMWSDVPMRPLTEGPIREGTRMELSFGMGPMKAKVGLEIVALVPNRRMSWKTFSGPIDWTGEYLLEPDGSNDTKLSQSGVLKFGGAWRFLEPVVGAEISKAETKELEKLKALAEDS